MHRNTRASNSRAQARAFTLVELLVVIGIIAVLIGVLLPVLAGVAARGRDVKCQANLRSCVQMMLTYATENKGSLPYGWYYNRSDPVTWDDAAGDGRLTTVFSLISKMASKHYKGDDVFIQSGQSVNPEGSRNNYAPYIRCPEAEQAGPHICSYAVQFSAFITPYYERIMVASGPIQDKPARTRDLFPFTILIHDTAVHLPGMNEDVGYVGDADVDGQRFWRAAAIPQHRYYDFSDPYSRIPPGIYGNNKPTVMGSNWKNIDPRPLGAEGFNTFPYQGNLRFRHNKNTTCNVGYADGRVERVEAKFLANGDLRTHGALRKSFMIKWPNGMGLQRNPSVP